MIFIIALLVTIISVSANAFLLQTTTKIFKLTNTKFNTALIVSVYYIIIMAFVGLVFGFIFSAIGLSGLSNFFAIIFSIYVFHKLFQKYYQTPFKKNFGIYIVSSILLVTVALVIIKPIRSFVVMPFYMKGESMEPTYKNNDYLIVNEFNKQFNRGDVVIFRDSKQENNYLIKRIIAIPGEKVVLKNGEVFITKNGSSNEIKLEEPYLPTNTKTFDATSTSNIVTTLKDNEYYMLGDNRTKSKDSRVLGPINNSQFLGKIWFKASEL